ncbi:SDR family NAD(P)-dependent oxidoreductase [Streptomyces sp. NPDC023723]|uniref:SDR family NAD(P)-dependent oxidoreductase n=1 Tax=Streptomyces sp. NPDC023723 TaxID=3154323 RepID=UPI003409C734
MNGSCREFAGRVVPATGAAGGSGAAQGARDALAGRDTSGPEALAAGLAREGRIALAGPPDLRNADATAVRETAARTEREPGPAAVLVNGAGALGAQPVAETGEEDGEPARAVHATGVFHVGRAVSRRTTPRHRGVIVTVACGTASRRA